MMDVMDHLDQQDLLVALDLQVLLETLVLRVLSGLLASQGRQEEPDLQVLQGPPEQPVTRDLMDCRE